MKTNKNLLSYSLLLFILFISGCGGGGGGNDVGGGGSGGDTNPPSTTTGPNDPTNISPVPVPNAELVNTPQSAQHKNIKLSFSESGDGIAVWEVGKEYGIKLVYSLYDAATASWSEEAVLAGVANVTGMSSFNFSVASNGTGFAISWEQSKTVNDDAVYVAVYSNGNWSATKRVDNIDGSSVGPLKLTSNSNGYMLVWTQSIYLRYSLYSNGAWSSAGQTTAPSLASIRDLASDGSGYLLTYCESSFCSNGISSIAFVNGSWSAPVYIADTNEISVASNGNGYMAVWTEGNDLFWGQFNGAAWSKSTTFLTDTAYNPSVLSNGTSYAVVYTDKTSSSSAAGIYTMLFNAATWDAAQLVDSGNYVSDLSLTTSGTDYGVSWESKTDLVINDFYTAVISGGVAQSPVLLENSTQKVTYSAIAGMGNGFAYAWAQYDGVVTDQVYTRMLDNTSGLLAKSSLLQMAHDSPASTPVIAVNASGQKVAVWKQEYFDPSATDSAFLYKSGLFASVYDSGTWGQAQLLKKYGVDPTVVSNGQSFLVMYYASSSPGGSLYASVYTNGSWVAPKSFDSSVYEMSAVASATGYAVTWQSNHSGDWGIYAYLYDETNGWELNKNRLDDTTDSAYLRSIVTNGSGYVVGWREAATNPADGFSNPYRLYASVHDGSNAGAWNKTLLQGNGNGGSSPSISSNGSGYIFVWTDNVTSELLASIFQNSTWQTKQRIDNGTSANPYVASNGTGYAVTWGGYPSGFANIFNGTNWLGEQVIMQPTNGAIVQIKANQQGYLAYWTESDLENSFYALRYDGTAWQQTPVLLSQNASVYKVLGNGNDYAIVYDDFSITDHHNIGYRLYDGLSWQPASLLENSNHSMPFAGKADVIKNGTGYTAVWAQAHGGYEDPVVSKVWHRTFGN